VTKVVTFGAFVEILPGVEGLVHISELATHHVENPREVVSQGDPVNVLILEIDGERRRLSLSLKRVEEGAVPVPRADGAESVHATPDLRLSEEAFPTGAAAVVEENADLGAAELTEATEADEEPVAGATDAADVAEEAPVVEADAAEVVAETAVVEEEAAVEDAEPVAEVEETDEVEPVAEAEPEAEPEAASDEPVAEAEADETA
jgi:small subunit ribosomal protein S1